METPTLSGDVEGVAGGEERLGDEGVHSGEDDPKLAKVAIAVGHDATAIGYLDGLGLVDDAGEKKGELHRKDEVVRPAVHFDFRQRVLGDNERPGERRSVGEAVF